MVVFLPACYMFFLCKTKIKVCQVGARTEMVYTESP